MTKSAIIATCLVNSNMISNLEDAENQVRAVFLEEFPNSHFYLWNGNVNDASAANIIKNVGRASMINVKKFIEDLAERGELNG